MVEIVIIVLRLGIIFLPLRYVFVWIYLIILLFSYEILCIYLCLINMTTNYSSNKRNESDSERSICEVPDSQDVVKKRAVKILECPRLLKHTFFLNEEGCPMHFIILHRDSEERTRLHKLLYVSTFSLSSIQNVNWVTKNGNLILHLFLKEHMASYSKNLDKITPHTAVLVADDCRTWSHDRDVFKISYIYESIQAGVILDISKFL